MKKNMLICSVLILCLLMENSINAATVTKVADNHSFGCQRPMATGLYDEIANKTFIVWNGQGMNIYVRSYDHNTEVWEEPVLVLDQNQVGKWDYHNYPTMILSPNGKLQIYYNVHTKKTFMIEAPMTHSNQGVWTKKEISNDKNCYPMPVVVGNDIYYFYSKNNDVSYPYRTFKYIKSTDNGASWSDPVTVVDSGKKDPNRFDEVYATQVKYDAKNAKIWMTWQMAGGPYGHNKQSKDLHMAYLSVENGKMYGVGDKACGSIVNYEDFNKTLVFKSEPGEPRMGYSASHNLGGGVFSWIGKVPVIAIGYHDVQGDNSKATFFYKWSGSEWVSTVISKGSSSVRDMDRLDNYWDDFRIIISNTENKKEVDIYTTNNGGLSFYKDDQFTLPLDNGANRANFITFIDDAVSTSNVEIMWAECGLMDPNDYTKGIWSVYTRSID